MRYANLVKYMNSFARVSAGENISQTRISLLCERVGRVNIGTKYIWIPSGSGGYATAIMLESVIKNAGYNVGRITSTGNFDCREVAYVNGEAPSMEDFNKAVSELKSAIQRDLDEPYTREETAFVLGLLLCKMSGCEYVILQGLSGKEGSLDAVCAPYDLIIMPTVYDSKNRTNDIKMLCDAIKRGTREVISGNQKSDVYNLISNACAMGGIRLYIPVKAQFEVTDITSRSLGFKYAEKEGYTLKSPSCTLRDCAMTVIESALAIRRSGRKLPWSSIKAGLAATINTGAFDMLSVSPRIITDSAEGPSEALRLLRTCDDVWGSCERISILCKAESKEEMKEILTAFADRTLVSAIFVSRIGSDADEIGGSVEIFDRSGEAVKKLLNDADADCTYLCFGGVDFSFEIKNEIMKKLNG